ncbi:hypothetical protein DFJ74DRAFT_474425 [Hyaloraphidium curvatum]|nr:hypothetical protein DFJ74DRAFT_474425 [Hyaloraphidium curvatum]
MTYAGAAIPPGACDASKQCLHETARGGHDNVCPSRTGPMAVRFQMGKESRRWHKIRPPRGMKKDAGSIRTSPRTSSASSSGRTQPRTRRLPTRTSRFTCTAASCDSRPSPRGPRERPWRKVPLSESRRSWTSLPISARHHPSTRATPSGTRSRRRLRLPRPRSSSSRRSR